MSDEPFTKAVVLASLEQMRSQWEALPEARKRMLKNLMPPAPRSAPSEREVKDAQ